MHSHTLAPLEKALKRVEAEREELQSERSAYAAFTERVAAVDVSRPTRQVPQSLVTSRRTTDGNEQVLSAFRETVGAVPHYEAVYDEPLVTHLTEELGPDIAAGLCGSDTLSPAFRRAILRAVDRETDNRETVLEQLETEAQSLAEAHSELLAVTVALRDCSAADGTASSETNQSLATIGERWSAVVEGRQALIQNRHISVCIDGHDFCSYLYGEEEGWTYPVLSVAASLRQDLDALERREASERHTTH